MNILNQGEPQLVSVDALLAHPQNPNIGSVDVIAESISENGWFGTILAQRSTSRVLVGHHRLLAARQLGAADVPVIWLDVDDQRALKIMLADNRSAELGVRDDQLLAALLSELETQSDLTGTGYTDTDLSSLMARLSTDLPASFRAYDETLDTAHKAKTCPHCGAEL